MEIIRDEEFQKEILAKIAVREFSERTGIHGSDLIYCLNKQAIRKLCPKPSTEREVLLFSLGWATQRWLTGKDEDEPEVEVDGIKVTPDARWKDGLYWELKCTFQSSAKPIEENIHWLRQLMSQCYVTKTTEIRLSRLELMGTWKSIFGKKEEKSLPENEKPTLNAYRITFTQEELDRHWEWMKQRRDLYKGVLEKRLLLPKLSALAPGMLWECDFCERKCSEREYANLGDCLPAIDSSAGGK